MQDAAKQTDEIRSIYAQRLTEQIAQRHSLTKFERLQLRVLIRNIKIAKEYKTEPNLYFAVLSKFCECEISAFERREFQINDELRYSWITKNLLAEGIALNEIFELKNPHDASVIRAFFERHNKDEINAALFDKTFPIAQKFEIKVSFTAEKDEKTVAYYLPRIKLITMLFNDRSKEYKAETLLHELIHSVSAEAICYIERRKISPRTKNTTLFLKPQIKLLGEIEMFHSALITLIKKDEHYGLKNAREFLAELVAPDFRELLQNMGLLEPILKKYFAFLESVAND